MKKWYAAGNKHPMKGKHHSAESIKKLRAVHGTPQARQIARERRLHQVFPSKDTKIEKILQNELEKKEIRFTKHKPIIGQPDIFIEPNICIFADGDFWHGWNYLQGEDFSHKKAFNNEYFKSRIQNDARITMQLDNLGYIILRFWEHEITKDREKCIKKIIKIIKEARKQTSTKNS
jgi:DNA mismatch endonuclease (patch repair protein)